MPAPRPNILFVCYEDSSPRFGAYGDGLARTPNFDRVAREGVRFSRCFSTAPVCGPSRSAVITGCYQTAIGCQNMRTTHTGEHTPELPTPYVAVPPAHVKCFTEYLRAASYFCAAQGKADYQFMREIQGYPISAFDLVVPPMATNTREGCRGQIPQPLWRQRPEGSPFFAYYNLDSTHESGQWPRADRLEPETDPMAVSVPPYLPDTLEVRKTIARQYDNLAKNDYELGKLLEFLEEDGVLEETLVVLWSDHGEGLPRGKRSAYTGGYHVPLVLRFPKLLAPGTVVDEVASNLDLAPTLFHLIGLAVPPHFQGLPLLGQGAQPRQYAHAGRDRIGECHDRVRTVRDRRFTYIRNYDILQDPYGWEQYRNQHPAMRAVQAGYAAGTLDSLQEQIFFGLRAAEELFDREVDPHELHNLAGAPEHAQRMQAFRRELSDWEIRYDPWRDQSEEDLARVFQPDGHQRRTATPQIFPLGVHCNGFHPMRDGDVLPGPALVQIHCSTQGASVVWELEPLETDNPRKAAWQRTDGPDRLDTSWIPQARLESAPAWKLYTRPLRPGPGRWLLRCRAVRYGYQVSGEAALVFQINKTAESNAAGLPQTF